MSIYISLDTQDAYFFCILLLSVALNDKKVYKKVKEEYFMKAVKFGCILLVVSLCALTYALTNAVDQYHSLTEQGIAAVVVTSVFLLIGSIVFFVGLGKDDSKQ